MARTQSLKVSIDKLVELVEAKKAADVAAYDQQQAENEQSRAVHGPKLLAWLEELTDHVRGHGRFPEGVSIAFSYGESDWRADYPSLQLPYVSDPAPKHDKILRLLNAAQDDWVKVDLESDLAAYL